MILLVTACGSKKEEKPAPAWKLYKSSRIRYLYRKAKEFNIPFYILSAKYGLVNSEQIIEPYDEIMTEEKCKFLIEQIKSVLKELRPEVIVFYKGGARKEYFKCLKRICEELQIPLKTFGYKIMGDIQKVNKIIKNYKEIFGK